MTKLLEEAFSVATHLPDTEQNIVAKWILSEIKSDKKWDEAFANSEDVLDKLFEEVSVAKTEKQIKPLELNNL